jgi:hypothetical protein
MVNLTELRRTLDDVLRFANKGQEIFSSRMILAEIVHPTVELLNAMETNRGQRWLTMEEAVSESGRTHNYFEKKLRSLGGRNRLETWKEQGFADQTGKGLWLISPVMVTAATKDTAGEEEAARAGAPADSESEVNNIIERFTRSAS